MRGNTLRRLAIGGLLGTALTLGAVLTPAQPAYAECDGRDPTPCVWATSVSSNHIEIYWQTSVKWDYFNVRCCRDVPADEQRYINSPGPDGSSNANVQPDSDVVFKVEGCSSGGILVDYVCSDWGELRVHTPPASGGTAGSGGTHGTSDSNGQLTATGSQAAPAPSLDFGPDTCPQGLVWRESSPGDHTCVTPLERALAKGKGNQQDIH